MLGYVRIVMNRWIENLEPAVSLSTHGRQKTKNYKKQRILF
jgi:hypothetical protein